MSSEQNGQNEQNEQNPNNIEKMLNGLIGGIGISEEVLLAKMNDQRLRMLAEYAASEGYTKMDIEPVTVQEKFIEFKQLVRKHSFTVMALETDVYNKYGITEKMTPQDPTGDISNKITGMFAPTKTTIGFVR